MHGMHGIAITAVFFGATFFGGIASCRPRASAHACGARPNRNWSVSRQTCTHTHAHHQTRLPTTAHAARRASEVARPCPPPASPHPGVLSRVGRIACVQPAERRLQSRGQTQTDAARADRHVSAVRERLLWGQHRRSAGTAPRTWPAAGASPTGQRTELGPLSARCKMIVYAPPRVYYSASFAQLRRRHHVASPALPASAQPAGSVARLWRKASAAGAVPAGARRARPDNPQAASSPTTEATAEKAPSCQRLLRANASLPARAHPWRRRGLATVSCILRAGRRRARMSRWCTTRTHKAPDRRRRQSSSAGCRAWTQRRQRRRSWTR